MPTSISKFIDPLFAAAQLVARDSAHAAHLVEQVMDRLAQEGKIEEDEAYSELERLAGTGRSEAGIPVAGADMLSSSRLREALDQAIPRVFSRLSPARRMHLWRSFQSLQPGSSEERVFLYAIRRELGSDHTLAAAEIGERELNAALERYFDTVLVPTPPSLRSDLESRHADFDAHMPGHVRDQKRFPWSARIAGAFLLILVATVLGMWLSRPSEPDSMPLITRSLLDVAAQAPPSGQLLLPGRDAEGMEQYIQDRLDRRARIPRIEDAVLAGMYIYEIHDGLEIPILEFSSTRNAQSFHIWVVDYALLDQLAPDFFLEPEVLNQIAGEDRFDIRDSANHTVVVFRYRDDIYVAVTSEDGISFRRRVSFPA